MNLDHIETNLVTLMKQYQISFCNKIYSEYNTEADILMRAFGITPELKRENAQYWGRELGMLWQLLVTKACEHLSNFEPALKIGNDEPCDLIVGNYAIDTKYRVGSGDSGTLKKFRSYSIVLKEKGYIPVVLFLREDNLPAAESAFSEWNAYKGENAFNFIKQIGGYDLKEFLLSSDMKYPISR